ncbi:preprotein translocase subunit SecE [Patescibacteria group bacterium]|nr:preprotein translocase subunit SecE [Patescibacteria group bacterium]
MKDNFIVNYFREAYQELHKVTWPTKNQAVRLTGLVIVFCVIVALLLGALDFGLNEAYTYLLTLR